MAGFGGVAEYGITVRWNKNYLKLVRLLLERRAQFALFGGVRFGGGATLSIDDAWEMGFDHIALCMGAGRPTVHRHARRPRPRRAPGQRLPDGPAAHRGRQDVVGRQPAGPHARRGDRRRADRPSTPPPKASPTTSGRWRNSPCATACWWRSAARRRCAAAGPPRTRKSPPSSSPMARPWPPNARPPRARAGRPASPRCWNPGAAPRWPIAAAWSKRLPTR